jgi:hypothetical protein
VPGHTYKDIARQLGVPLTTIKDAVSGKTWKHVP